MLVLCTAEKIHGVSFHVSGQEEKKIEWSEVYFQLLIQKL